MSQWLEVRDDNRPEVDVEDTEQEQNVKNNREKNQRFHVSASVPVAIEETPGNTGWVISSAAVTVNYQHIHLVFNKLSELFLH